MPSIKTFVQKLVRGIDGERMTDNHQKVRLEGQLILERELCGEIVVKKRRGVRRHNGRHKSLQ